MPEGPLGNFIKAYSREDRNIIELEVSAVTERIARLRARGFLRLRFPAAKLNIISVKEFPNDKLLNDYRVVIELEERSL